MTISQAHFDKCRSRHLHELHRELVSVSEDSRDSGQIYESVLHLTRSLCAEVESFCVVLLELPKGPGCAQLDAPIPKGSGVLVYSRSAPCEDWGILTAAHVLDEFVSRGGLDRIWIASPFMIRSGRDCRPVALQHMQNTYVLQNGPHPEDWTIPPDIGWLGLSKEDVGMIQAHGGVFFNLDAPRDSMRLDSLHEESPRSALPRCSQALLVGTLGYNYRTGRGPERDPASGDVPLNLCTTLCGEPRPATPFLAECGTFDFQATQPTHEYGSLGDPVANRLGPDSWKGMSGCGYWRLVFGAEGDPVDFEVRLDGLVFSQLGREADGGQCLRAHSRAAIDQLLRDGKSRQAQEKIVV